MILLVLTYILLFVAGEWSVSLNGGLIIWMRELCLLYLTVEKTIPYSEYTNAQNEFIRPEDEI
jgi:hypothetical protein